MSDISSDPVDGNWPGHTCNYGEGNNCAGCDISSVTGSTWDEYDRLIENAINAHDYAAVHTMRAAIQREAVDAFIRDELPVLLTVAFVKALPDATPDDIAAKVAELRSERETGK